MDPRISPSGRSSNVGAQLRLLVDQDVPEQIPDFHAIEWDDTDYDTAQIAPNLPTSLFVVPEPGVYLCSSNILWDANAAGANRRIRIFAVLSGVNTIAGMQSARASGNVANTIVAFVRALPGDTIEFQAGQDSGGTRQILGTGGLRSSGAIQKIAGFS